MIGATRVRHRDLSVRILGPVPEDDAPRTISVYHKTNPKHTTRELLKYALGSRKAFQDSRRGVEGLFLSNTGPLDGCLLQLARPCPQRRDRSTLSLVLFPPPVSTTREALVPECFRVAASAQLCIKYVAMLCQCRGGPGLRPHPA